MQTTPHPQIMAAMAKQALLRDPRNADLYFQLGTAQFLAGQPQQAVAALRQAVALRENFLEAQINLGNALIRINAIAQAQAPFERALTLSPADPRAAYGLGVVLQAQGELSRARDLFAAAVAADPTNPTLLRVWAERKRFAPDDPLIAHMESLLRTSADVATRMNLHFALATAYDAVGRQADAMAQWRDGNAIMRRNTPYHEREQFAIQSQTAASYTTDIFRRFSAMGDSSTLPIFVVGMPRSGTTLVEQILASHPAIFGAGEIDTFATCIRTIMSDPRQALAPVTFSKHLLRRLGGRYVEMLRPLAPQAQRIVNKTPGNFHYCGLIHLALPQARIIHVRRDPLDTCFSCFTIPFGESNAFTYDLAELGRYYRAYAALMAHWRTVLPATALLEIDYETLVDDFPAQARRLIAFCGLEWNDRCLEFHRTPRIVQTASQTQVRQPIYKRAIGRGHAYATYLEPLIAALGPAG